MDEIIRAAKAHLANGMSACATIRQVAAENIDLPRKELVAALVSCGLNVATVRTQIQRAKGIAAGKTPVPASKSPSSKSATPAARPSVGKTHGQILGLCVNALKHRCTQRHPLRREWRASAGPEPTQLP